MLNAGMKWETLPDDVKRAFIGQQAELREFLAGTQFYKFTDRPLLGSGSYVTPWWSGVDPLDSSDPGLNGVHARAQDLGVDPAKFARARSAVTLQWNSMTGLLVVQLIQPVCGFVGRCSHQRMDAGDPKVVFIGGGWQVYVPNLTPNHVLQV